MTSIVEGIYKQGKIELFELPPDLPEGRVRVIVISQGSQPKLPPRMITFGMYRGERMSTLEDFTDAEWRGANGWDEENAE
jgi:hypothetical protein